MRFYNRKRELKILDNQYNSHNFEFVLVHGRRRIGKTYLLRHFVQEKRYAFYVANQQGPDIQLPRLYSEVSMKLTGGSYKLNFNSVEEFFKWLTDQITETKEKTVLVLDEFQYLVEIYPSLPSVIKTWIEDYWINTNFMLIICGSEIGMMLELVQMSQPLYGMITSKLEIKPFKFLEVMSMFQGLDINTVLKIYGVFGGSPAYLIFYDTKMTFTDNVLSTIFSYGHKLFDEPSNLIQSELPHNHIYMDILYAIATGNNKISEIAELIKKDARNVPRFTRRLEQLGLISKLIPIGEKSKSRNTKYLLDDSFFKFWFRFKYPNNTAIEEEDFDFLRNLLEDNLDNYMGQIFETIVIQIITKHNTIGTLPFKADPQKIGNWWTKKGGTIELDCIALDRLKKPENGLFIEIKWNQRIKYNREMKKLIGKVQQSEFGDIANKWFGILARGFDATQHLGAVTIKDLVSAVIASENVTFLPGELSRLLFELDNGGEDTDSIADHDMIH